HPRPLLLASGGRSASEAGERGAALGLLPDERYAATDLSLAPGDRLVLYSDGLVEAKAPDGALFDVQRLRGALTSRAALPAEAWADHVLEEVTRWIGKPDLTLDDDLTLVVLDMPAGDAGAS
ncbi:MAG: serine/threonine-protein phosphatase, partial [Acidobacteria bacterium]|nr:serine/threonine-protein phosphatase [Acidobacteriota bacterium]